MLKNKSLYYTVCSAILMGLAFHPISLGWFAWFGLIPLFFALSNAQSYKETVFIGFIWGITHYLVTIYWLGFNIGTTRVIGIISMLFAVVYLTLWPMVAMPIWRFLQKKYENKSLWIFPFVWVSMEYLRSFDALGFPWISLANTQTDFLTIVQNAEITGIYGISFWVVMINVSLYLLFAKFSLKNVFNTILLFTSVWIAGFILTPNHSEIGKGLLISTVQPNIHLKDKHNPNFDKENLNKLLELTNQFILKETSLIFWPESSTPDFFLQNKLLHKQKVVDMLTLYNAKLITGTTFYERLENDFLYFNSVAEISKLGDVEKYHKIRPVPMAEYIPFSDSYPGLKKLNFGQANFETGVDYTLFNINDIPFATMICMESTFPNLSRKFVQKGAQFLSFVVNDGWYESAPEPQQHARQSIYRAVENRRPVVRCANTGISMIIDERGNITHELGLNTSGCISTRIYPSKKMTFYSLYGDIFAQLILILTIGLGIILIRKK